MMMEVDIGDTGGRCMMVTKMMSDEVGKAKTKK